MAGSRPSSKSPLPPGMQRIGRVLTGLAMGATAAWLLFGDPPTIFLFAVIIVTGLVLLAPKRKQLRRNRDE